MTTKRMIEKPNSFHSTMRFYEPASEQPCYYCKRIHKTEDAYPLRDASYTFEKMVYRCQWHSRFKCVRCGNEHHFSWFYWCPKSQELICGDCNQPTLFPVQFWDWTYAYEFHCKECNEVHHDLLYSEYRGMHPWQEEYFGLKTILDESEPWMPLWTPSSTRSGMKISLEDSLKLENRVLKLRHEFQHWTILKSAVPVNDIEFEDQQSKWEHMSEVYIQFAEEGDLNRKYVIDPALWELVGDVRGFHVLDAGCGSGYLTRQLASKGANAVGVDFSQPFIDYCQLKESELNQGSRYLKASLTDLSDLEDRTFDLVVSNVVFVDILDYELAFKEIHRILKDTGRFIWSNTHPVFGGMRAADIKFPSDSYRNEDRYVKMIDGYFYSGGTLVPWMETEVWQFDRTLSEYSKALKDAGFVISEIVEPKPPIELIRQHPRHLAFDADRWTHFIIFECIKR